MEKVPMTAEGYTSLEAEIKNLKTAERPRIIKLIADVTLSVLYSGSPMPMNTTLVRRRSSPGLFQSFSVSLATISWATISPVVRFRTIRCVPV